MNDTHHDIRDSGGQDRLALLQTFLRVAESGSFSAAAQQLGTTQPTVSRRVQMLESLLGARLVERSTRGLRLTEEGHRALVQAQSLVDRWDALADDLSEDTRQLSGVLRLHVPHAFGQNQLVEPMAALMKQHPGLSIEWTLQDQLPDFSREAVDCSLTVGHVEQPDLIAVQVAEVPRVLVAAPALAAQLPDDIGTRPPEEIVDTLRAQPWLALSTYYRDEIQLRAIGYGQSLNVPIRCRMGTNSLFALISAARHGLGLAAVSHWAVIDDLAQGRLVRLLPQWCATPLPVSLVYPSRQHQPARLRAFVALMRETVPRIFGMREVSRS
ncbi:LysR family transcriptional regulator [Piscinibacter terrae]|uniref:LysR family transcriptional regulator n=1 Tax=Piscinibacter terrae TaxID=2496871 RepID=A0A3N7HM30_9BURK|nr:LysR family transcriptional regulator [Albitalea terrae]RQP22663.1 LysR family transcriptional regulator [Albitalea terrae]